MITMLLKTQIALSLVFAAAGASSALADCPSCNALGLSLPSAIVSAQQDVDFSTSYFKVTLTNTPSGYSVSNGTYRGWCVDETVFILSPNSVKLISSYDSSMPANIQSPNWGRINYVLNHKQGGYSDVQTAIWKLLGQPSQFPSTPVSDAIYQDAMDHGAGFVPGEGQAVAVILYVDGFGGQHQDTILELHCPLTQGYWQNHPDAWPVPMVKLGSGLIPKNDALNLLNTPVRGIASTDLAHQLIAAELNIASGVNPEPVQAVIDQANSLLATFGMSVSASTDTGQQMTALADKLDQFNEGNLTGLCTVSN